MSEQPGPFRFETASNDLPPEGEHLWVAMVAFRVVDPASGVIDLSPQSLVGSPYLACVRCETTYDDDVDPTCVEIP